MKRDMRDPQKMGVVFDRLRAQHPDIAAHVIADMVDLHEVDDYTNNEGPLEKYGVEDRVRVTVTREVIA